MGALSTKRKHRQVEWETLAEMGCCEYVATQLRNAPGQFFTVTKVAQGWWCPEGVRALQREQLIQAFEMLCEDGTAVPNAARTAIRLARDDDFADIAED